MNLGRIDWPSALSELRKAAATTDGKRRLAQASSLAARFARGYDEGASYALDAAKLEPLNPLHHVRFALHCLRYGQHERALAVVDALAPVKDLPAVRTVRALATLQSGEDRRAANIARDLALAHPTLISAAFLQADAHLRPQLKEAEARSQTLPRDPKHAVAWTHLLVKRIVARPKESAKVLKNHLDARPVLEKDSPHATLVRQAAEWSTASRADLATALATTRIGSKAEELVLSLYVEQLREANDDALKELAALHRAHLDRPAVRRVYVSELTRVAVEHATKESWSAALRVIEVAARLEPHEPVHVQNRAAVLTAMADDAQHEAWAELDRLHYRLALAGCLDAEMARRIAKPHRMHAEQARLTPIEAPGGPAWGVFKVVEEEEEEGAKARGLEVNQKQIEEDPEVLRAFIHQRRAELVWRHLALGADPRKVLLGPTGPKAHRARVRALCIGAESLAVLVPEEGRVLADRIAKGFRALPVGRTHYHADPTTDDATTTALKREYAEAVADFAFLAWKWQVDPKRADIVEELIEAIEATTPFLEDRALVAQLAPDQKSELSNAGFLGFFVRMTLGQESGPILIDDGDRKRLGGRLCAELLLTLATRRLDAVASLGRPDIERALSLVDRARDLDPTYARVEYLAARMCIIGEFYDEARACIARFTAIPGSRETPFQQSIEESQRILDEKKKQNAAGNTRSGSAGTFSVPGRSDDDLDKNLSRVERLEAEIDKFPSSVQLYEELARALCMAARFDVARSWCTRAIGRCLQRKAQVRARLLEVEVIGLELLAPKHFGAVEVYLSGSHGAALENVEATLAENGHYALHYLRGTCLLARRNRPEAERAFKTALESCTQQLHRAALRPMAEDVDGALLEQTRAAIESALAAGKIKDAMREATTALSEARAPEAVLLDLARVQLAAAVAAVSPDKKDEAAPPAMPALDQQRAPWSGRLATALADANAVNRARAVASLAEQLHEPSKKEAAVLLRRIEAFANELAFAETVTEATRLERRGDFAKALVLLEAAGEGATTDARALKLRAMLLLRLDRFADADAALEILKASGHPSAKSLVEKWPDLRFKLGLGAVTRMLRDNAIDKAHALLQTLKPTSLEGELEWAYSRAFCLARIARRLHDEGNRGEALERMEDAVEILETKLATKEGAAHPRIRELRDRLDTDLGHMRGTDR